MKTTFAYAYSRITSDDFITYLAKILCNNNLVYTCEVHNVCIENNRVTGFYKTPFMKYSQVFSINDDILIELAKKENLI